MKKKLFAVMTAATMLFGSFGAFATTALANDLIPAYDFGGRTIKFQLPDHYCPERADEANRDFYIARHAEVQEKFNVVLETNLLEGVGWNDIPIVIVESIAAGDPLVDVYVSLSAYYNSPIMGAGHAYDMTDVFVEWGMPKAYYDRGQGMWQGRAYSFTNGLMGNMHALIYNRELIQQAGMDKDIGEMILAGTWSWDEAFDYMVELNDRLPDDVHVISTHINHLVRGFVFSNGMRILDPMTNVPMFTQPEYYAAMDFLNRCYQAGLIMQPHSMVTNAEGVITGSNWNAPIGDGFAENTHVIAWTGAWNLGSFGAQVEWGAMIWPWGPNVTMEGDDFHSLSDNYATYTVDLGTNVVMRHAVEDYGIPAEAYLNLFYSYFAESYDTVLTHRENEAAGEPYFRSSRGTPRDLFTDYDIEIYDFFLDRMVFEAMETNGTGTAFNEAAAAGGNPATFFGIHNRILMNNSSAREMLEGFMPAALYGLSYRRIIDRANLSADQLALIDVFDSSVAQHAVVTAKANAAAAVEEAMAAVWEALEEALENDIDVEVCDDCGAPIFN